MKSSAITRVVHLPSIAVDKDIIFRDGSKHRQTSSPYAYAVKVVEFNRTRLREQYGLRSVYVDHDNSQVQLQGENAHNVSSAAQAVIVMLQKPVLVYSVDPELVVALRLFKDMKKEFSTHTGCWLHFIWMTRTVTCYGLDGQAASDYLTNIMEGLRCSTQGTGFMLTNVAFGRSSKDIIKRQVDEIEAKSGARLAIKEEQTSGIVVQFYGKDESIGEALRQIEYYGGEPALSSSAASSVGPLGSFPEEWSEMGTPPSPLSDLCSPLAYPHLHCYPLPPALPVMHAMPTQDFDSYAPVDSGYTYTYSNSPYAFVCSGCGMWTSTEHPVCHGWCGMKPVPHQPPTSRLPLPEPPVAVAPPKQEKRAKAPRSRKNKASQCITT